MNSLIFSVSSLLKNCMQAEKAWKFNLEYGKENFFL